MGGKVTHSVVCGTRSSENRYSSLLFLALFLSLLYVTLVYFPPIPESQLVLHVVRVQSPEKNDECYSRLEKVITGL